jgi:hypothetical protein
MARSGHRYILALEAGRDRDRTRQFRSRTADQLPGFQMMASVSSSSWPAARPRLA